MRTLLQLFIRNGGFVTFVLVEFFCFYLIVQYNTQQNAIYANTVGIFAGNLLERRQQALDYIGLNARVDSLLKENAGLQSQLANARVVQVPRRDTFYRVLFDTISRVDSLRHRLVRPDYGFIPGHVVGNTISSANNTLILNRGKTDGITPNMAVVSRSGIVGIIRHVGPHFSIAMSVLHRQARIIVSLPKHNDAFGTLMWEGGDPSVMILKNIPKHFKVEPGESVVTSGYSQMFPKQILVGYVEGKPEQDPETPYFLQMHVRLSQDMATVGDVYIVNNLFSAAIDSLKVKVKDEQ
jgi:rod shape-determining protein MreC